MTWLVAAACIASQCAAQPLAEVPKTGPIPEAPGSFDYPSVAAALDALRAKPGTTIREQAGWTIVEEKDSASATLWSFTPPNHPAHPSAIKRQMVNEDGQVNLHMTVKCEAAKSACDALVREFEGLNQQMIKAIRGH
jgi:hypothetical protein